MVVEKMNDQYIKLAKLNSWANDELRKVMGEFNSEMLKLGTPYGTIHDLVIHLINAINHWLDFFDYDHYIPRSNNDIDYNNWNEVLTLWKKTDKRLSSVIETFNEEEGFEREFIYSHNREKHYRMSFGDLFLHLSHHSYYHRGQLAMLFRQNDLRVAPPTDADLFFAFLQD
ncbi:MAG: DinB family protein [Candidatus Hodarchaeales archaeon]